MSYLQKATACLLIAPERRRGQLLFEELWSADQGALLAHTHKSQDAAPCGYSSMVVYRTMAVIVTGAAMSIGKAVALALAKEGKAVVMVDRAAEQLNEAAAEAKASGSGTETVVGDVADPETATASVNRAVGVFGRLDGLSHNAGIQRYGTAVSTPYETWNEVLAVNLSAAFYFARAALPELVKTKGAVVMMASVQGLATQRGVAAYTMPSTGLSA